MTTRDISRGSRRPGRSRRLRFDGRRTGGRTKLKLARGGARLCHGPPADVSAGLWPTGKIARLAKRIAGAGAMCLHRWRLIQSDWGSPQGLFARTRFEERSMVMAYAARW